MKIIIFDFDGTIANSFKLLIEIAHNLTGHEKLINPKEVTKLKHDSMVEVAKELNIPKYMWPFLVFKGRRQMSQRLNEVKPFDGMDEVFSALHDKGYRMLIISTNSTSNIATFLVAHGLSGYFENVYGNIGLLNKASALKKVMDKNKLSSEDVVYVGDEVRDIEAAKSVGVPIVAVSWGFNDARRLASEKPTAIVHNRPELTKILEFWGTS